MDWKRLYHSARMCLILSPTKRADYIRKHNVFYHVGNNCMFMFRKIPLYAKLISIGNNVWIASNVHFTTHDVIHRMLNNLYSDSKFTEKIGCILIGDNCFIGADTIILPNVKIGSRIIIGAGSLVNKDLPDDGVYAGVPAKYICPIDDIISKRKEESNYQILKKHGDLTTETVESIWRDFLLSVGEE